MKRLLALLLLLGLVLTGCNDKNKEKALRFDIDHFPGTLDSQMATEHESILVLINTMAGLTKVEHDGKVVPDLCEKWETSKEGREYTFTLRDNLKWEDGRELTSRDFQFALRRLVSPKTHSPYAYRYMNIINAKEVAEGKLPEESLGVRTPDDKTLVITLNEPDVSIPSLMAQVSSFPCNEEFFDSCKGKYGLSPKNFLASGAFSLSSLDENLMLLKSNKNALNPAKTEKLYFCTGRGEITDVFLDGRSEACIVSFNDYEKVKSYPSDAIYNRTFSLIINPESETGKNEIYRKALLASPSSRENSIEGTDSLIKAEGIVPPATLLEDINYRESAGKVSFPKVEDMAELKSELQKEISGEKDEKMPKTEIITNDDELNFTIASEIQSIYSTDLSLYVNILPLGNSQLAKSMASGDFQVSLGEIKPFADKPSLYLMPFADIVLKSGERVGDLLEKADGENNKYRKIGLFKEIENALISEYYVLPLYHAPNYIVTAPNVSGIEYMPSKQAIFFGNAVLKEK